MRSSSRKYNIITILSNRLNLLGALLNCSVSLGRLSTIEVGIFVVDSASKLVVVVVTVAAIVVERAELFVTGISVI